MQFSKAPWLALVSGWVLMMGLSACQGPGVETCNDALSIMKKGTAPGWSVAKAQVIKDSQMIESVCQAQIQYKRTFEGTKANEPTPAAQREFYVLTVHHSQEAAAQQKDSYAQQAVGPGNPALAEKGYTNIYIRNLSEQKGKISLVSQMLCEDVSGTEALAKKKKKKKKKKKGAPATGFGKKGMIDECAQLTEDGNKMAHKKVGQRLMKKILQIN